MNINVGVYVTLLNDEYLVPHCLKPIIDVFPQVKVLDFGSTDSSCSYVPDSILIKHAPLDAVSYIQLKNEYSNRHDQVFWIDSDEIYPIAVLKKLKEAISKAPDQIPTYWRNVVVTSELKIYIERPYLRGTAVWNPKCNHLVRAWPNERLVCSRDNSQLPKDPGLFCWHAVLLNRSSVKEPASRYKKRVDRHAETVERGTLEPVSALPWEDASLGKYVPIYRAEFKSKRRRG